MKYEKQDLFICDTVRIQRRKKGRIKSERDAKLIPVKIKGCEIFVVKNEGCNFFRGVQNFFDKI